MKSVWIVFMSPYEQIIYDVFDSEEKAEEFRLEKIREWDNPKPIHGTPYFYKKEFEVK